MKITIQVMGVLFSMGAASWFVISKAQQNPVQGAETKMQSDATVLLQEFKAAEPRSRQVEIGEKLVARQDKSVVPAMLLRLKSQDRLERCNAGRVLAGLGDDRGLLSIIAELKDTGERPTQRLGGDGKTPDVAGEIRQDRYYAAHVLGTLGDKRAVPALITLLNDKDLDYQAAFILGQLGDKRAMPALRRKRSQLQIALKNNRSNTSADRLAAFAASAALAQLGDAQGMTELSGYLKDKDWLWRRYAVEAFGEFSAMRGVALLTPMLHDPSERVRISAAQSLGKIGDKAALPALIVANSPEDTNISWRTVALAQAANKAISAIWHKNGITGMAMRNGGITGYSYAPRSKPFMTVPNGGAKLNQ